MRRLPLLLAAVVAALNGADDTPANRKLVQELDHKTSASLSLAVAIDTAAAMGSPTKAKLFSEEIDRKIKGGLIDRIAARLDKEVLRVLTNEELQAWHKWQTYAESTGATRKLPLMLADIMPVMQDEMMYCVGKNPRRTTFEIEQPWDIIPAERRAILRELTPLLVGTMGDQSPAAIKAGLIRQVETEAAARKMSSAVVEQIRSRIASFDTNRISRSMEESTARHLTTNEARWQLESLKDPRYRSAQPKIAAVTVETIEKNLR